MKAILEFNLPEEDTEHYYAVNGDKFAFVISDINDWLRDILKYNSEKNSEDALEAFEKTRKERRMVKKKK